MQSCWHCHLPHPSLLLLHSSICMCHQQFKMSMVCRGLGAMASSPSSSLCCCRMFTFVYFRFIFYKNISSNCLPLSLLSRLQEHLIKQPSAASPVSKYIDHQVLRCSIPSGNLFVPGLPAVYSDSNLAEST